MSSRSLSVALLLVPLLGACGGSEYRGAGARTAESGSRGAGATAPTAGAEPGAAPAPTDPATAGVVPATTMAAPAALQMNAAAEEPYRAGLQAFAAGDMAGAKAQFGRAVDADDRAFQAQFSLGVVHERLGAKASALAAYRAATSISKGYEPAIAAYALLLARTGEVGEAADVLNHQRAALPGSAAVLAALAEVKSIQRDSAAAQQLAQEALKKNPDYRPAMVTLARDHYRARRLDLALYTLTAILDGYGPENPPRDKNNAEALLLRGLIYKEQGKRRDAFADFKRAVGLRPDLVEAKINLAKYMLEAGNANESAPLLESVLGYDPANVFVHLDLGDAYRLQGRPGEALKHFQWVIAKEPTLAEAHYNMGLLYLLSSGIPDVTPQQAIEKAISELEKFKAMRPRTRAGVGDDVDELLGRAKNKKAILAAEAANPTPAPAPATPGGASKSVTSSGSFSSATPTPSAPTPTPSASTPARAPAPAPTPTPSASAPAPAPTPTPTPAPTAPPSKGAFPSK